MDNKNKIFFAVFFTLIAAVVIITFTKYFVAKDYYIEAQADCDPYTQKCFIWNCDPNSQVEGEKCTGDPETDIWYYQNVKKIANEIPLCDPNSENCNALACEAGMDCEVTYCDESTVEEGITCNDPVKYTEENPVEEESSAEECAPDDEECINTEDSSDSIDSSDESSSGDESSVNVENFVS
ncbi:MAG: hypothetical protein WCV59_02830 [Parcubacteria group bacterium]|jgi:hypothetical protein